MPQYEPDAGVAELADALDSKSSDRKIVWVRAPPPAMTSQIALRCWTLSATHLSQLFATFIWKKTVPHRFIGIASLALRIPRSHRFQCKQRAIASRVERAHRCCDVR